LGAAVPKITIIQFFVDEKADSLYNANTVEILMFYNDTED
jgi:hypothetical protein